MFNALPVPVLILMQDKMGKHLPDKAFQSITGKILSSGKGLFSAIPYNFFNF